jgi:hypothetical protein
MFTAKLPVVFSVRLQGQQLCTQRFLGGTLEATIELLDVYQLQGPPNVMLVYNPIWL